MFGFRRVQLRGKLDLKPASLLALLLFMGVGAGTLSSCQGGRVGIPGSPENASIPGDSPAVAPATPEQTYLTEVTTLNDALNTDDAYALTAEDAALLEEQKLVVDPAAKTKIQALVRK